MKRVFLLLSLASLLFTSGGTSPVEEMEAIFDQPLLITSVGQSADVQLASVLAKKAGLAYTLNKTASQNDLAGIKTLALVLGASLKGLGAAGLDVAKEKDRIAQLVGEARKRNIPVLCLHLGGDSRRGSLSDNLIKEFLPAGRMAIVVKSGNNDGLFTEICRKHNILLIEVEKTISAEEPLKKVFKTREKS